MKDGWRVEPGPEAVTVPVGLAGGVVTEPVVVTDLLVADEVRFGVGVGVGLVAAVPGWHWE